MAKKHVGRFLTFAAIAGAAVAGISYFLQYKSFHKELDEEFHDFEDDFEEFEDTNDNSATSVTRNYVSLTPEKKTDGAQDRREDNHTEEDLTPTGEESPDSIKKEPGDVQAQTEETKPEAAGEKNDPSQTDTTVTVEEMTE